MLFQGTNNEGQGVSARSDQSCGQTPTRPFVKRNAAAGSASSQPLISSHNTDFRGCKGRESIYFSCSDSDDMYASTSSDDDNSNAGDDVDDFDDNDCSEYSDALEHNDADEDRHQEQKDLQPIQHGVESGVDFFMNNESNDSMYRKFSASISNSLAAFQPSSADAGPDAFSPPSYSSCSATDASLASPPLPSSSEVSDSDECCDEHKKIKQDSRSKGQDGDDDETEVAYLPSSPAPWVHTPEVEDNQEKDEERLEKQNTIEEDKEEEVEYEDEEEDKEEGQNNNFETINEVV